MPNTIKHKTSALPGKTPTASDLVVGELALNTSDGVMYAKMADNSIRQVQFIYGVQDYGMTAEASTSVEDFGFLSDQPTHGIEYGGI